MLHHAVNEHTRTVTAPRSSTLAQPVQIINGSTAPKRTSEMAFSSSRLQNQEASNGRTSGSLRPNLLKPSPDVLLNVACRAVGGSDETASTSQRSGLPGVLNKSNSFQENVVTAAVLKDNQDKLQGVRPLQSAVYFDENDFDDDDDLDLDIEDPSLKECMLPPPQKSASCPNPVLSKDADTGVQPYQPSSAPLPWSSSPAESRAAPARRPLSKTQSAPSDVQGGGDVNPRPKKRRNLPWMQSPGNEAINDDYPWERTASAVKQDQRRRTNKKGQDFTETNKTTSEASLSSKRKDMGKVFLTDEQKHVADLVILKGKSVFFTGSAG